MFDALPGFWLPAAFSKQLKKKPLSVYLANESLVLFRDHQGKACGLLDQCPHRGVALSLGTVNAEGCLECPFHGWNFRGDGSCAFVPFNPELSSQRLATLGATGLSVHEQCGLIWVYTGVGEPTPKRPVIPEPLLNATSLYFLESNWLAHWTRAMENMLDVPHLPFIHRRTIGRGLPNPRRSSQVPKKSLPHIDFDLVTLETGFKLTSIFDGVRHAEGGLEWQMPCLMILKLSPTVHLHNFCVPGAYNQTRMMIISAYQGPILFRPFYALMSYFNRFILAEDQKVIESSTPPEIPVEGFDSLGERKVAFDGTGHEIYENTEESENSEGESFPNPHTPLLGSRRQGEKTVPSDAPTLVFRRWYRQQMHP
jgi:nitrite reductase/ring-hydroxylating ferredoxin subunit